ncbi:MAG: hypothetical protein ACR2NP_13840 [Pirellulaceae bacterium]
MRRRRPATASLAVSLFPFLAVLICTMGVLIVMLVLAVKSSTVKAREARDQHEQKLHDQRESLLDQLDLEEFRVRELAAMRPQAEQRLADERLRRSHLQDEIRRLIDQTDTLRRQTRQLDEDQDLAQDSRDADARKIEQLEKQIAARKKELGQLRTEVSDRPQMYSIVPTRGASGTLRRPIYVECTPAGMFLQPSGIQITARDFTRPVLPGNPLDAALLATREHWNKYEAGASEGEPYPLLVVRPGGATAYALARRAMQSWDDEFGYELVESTKQLDWGTIDENLVNSVQQAIALAKQEQKQHVAFGRAQWLADAAYASAGGGGTRDGWAGTGPPAGSGHFNSGGSDPQGDGPNGSLGSESGGRDSMSGGNGSGAVGSGSGAGTGSGREAGGGDQSLAASGSMGQETRAAQGQGQQGQTAGQFRDGGTNSGQGNSAQMASRDSTFQPASGNPFRHGQQGPNSAGSSSGGAAGMGSPTALAHERGQNWGLRTRTPGATPYRRPIRVECGDSHYLVHSSDPDRSPSRVQIDGNVDSAIDQLVNQIWNQIEGWGMAEIGGYWKPVLRLSPQTEAGIRRALELEQKLGGSGIEIERMW